MVASAAALVLVGGAVAVGRTVGGGLAGAPSTSTSPGVHRETPVVPWRDLPARHPDVAHLVDGRRVTPFDNVMAGGTIAGRLHPGETLEFTVVLESPSRVRLDPCPDYEIGFGARGFTSGQLNCAQVPYRDGRGRPVLPAVTPVRFDMRMTVPDVHGRQKVLWTLVGPQAMPGFYGVVRVE
jgi:hypothetical protein